MLAFDEYGNEIAELKATGLGAKVRVNTMGASHSSLKSRISNRRVKTDKQLISALKLRSKSKMGKSRAKNITSNANETFEALDRSKAHAVISNQTQLIDLKLKQRDPVHQTSIELTKRAKPGRPKLFEESNSLKTNIKLTESNVQVSNSQQIGKSSGEKKSLPGSGSVITDVNILNALRNMRNSISQIKRKGASELKIKSDASRSKRQGSEELAVMCAGLGGDISRVHKISHLSFISELDRSGDTLLNLEKYLGGLSAVNGDAREELKLTGDELPKLKFLLEKVRLVLGKSNRVAETNG